MPLAKTRATVKQKGVDAYTETSSVPKNINTVLSGSFPVGI